MRKLLVWFQLKTLFFLFIDWENYSFLLLGRNLKCSNASDSQTTKTVSFAVFTYWKRYAIFLLILVDVVMSRFWMATNDTQRTSRFWSELADRPNKSKGIALKPCLINCLVNSSIKISPKMTFMCVVDLLVNWVTNASIWGISGILLSSNTRYYKVLVQQYQYQYGYCIFFKYSFILNHLKY